MVEKRTRFGVLYQSKVHPIERTYPLSYHFVDDGNEERVEVVWEGRWAVNNKKGWRVGSDVIELTDVTYDRDLVVQDGSTYATSLHPVRVRRIK